MIMDKKEFHPFITKEMIKPEKTSLEAFAKKLKFPIEALVSYRESGVEKKETIKSKKEFIELSKKAYITVYTGTGKNRRVNTVMNESVISANKMPDDLVL